MKDEQFNFEEPSEPQPKPKKKNYVWVYITIIALLVLTNLFLFFRSNEAQDQSNQIMGQASNIISEKEALREEYDASLARLDLLTTENATLKDQLNLKNEDLEKEKKRIQEILSNKNATETELKEARRLIQQLNQRIATYEEEIALLKQDNQNLRTTIDSITVEQQQLKQQIEEAKVLAIGNIKLSAISLRRQGKVEKETVRARRADLLRVTFDLVENRLLDDSDEKLYISITNPEGYLLSNAALGSGSFKDEKGENVFYSMSKTFNIQKALKIKEISADWVQSSDYTKGEYEVIIYHKNYIIGQGKVSLR